LYKTAALSIFKVDSSAARFSLKAALKSKKYDIIHIHSLYGAIFYIIAIIFWREKRLLARTVFTIHDTFPDFNIKHRLMLIPIMFLFHRLVCCGQASFESVPSFYRWLAGSRLCYIPNGVNIEQINNEVSHISKDSKSPLFTIVVIGRLRKVKAPFDILRALKQIDDENVRIVFLGQGPLFELLMSEIRKLGLSNRVELAGAVSRSKVYEYLVNADVFLTPSRGEGLPVAVLEAMACRCPVILSDIPSHREITSDADFIPLVKLGGIAGFANEIRKFKKMSKQERIIIGEKCRELVEKRFSLTLMLERYKKMYLDVLAEQ